MAARAVITMSPEQYLAGLKQLEAATNKSASKMENSFKEYGTSINKAGIAMRYVSAEMGAGAVAFGRAFQVLAGGKIAIAVAAITGAIVALKKTWDELTESADEYNAKLDKSIEANERNIESMRKTQSEEDEIMDRLQELSERENKTNEEHDEAIRLTQILAERYTGLGLQVNGATGEFEDLAEAMKQINAAQREARLDALATQIANLGSKTDSLIKNKLKGGIFAQLWDWGTTALGEKTKGQSNVDLYNSLTSGQKLAFANNMLENGANTEDDIRFWSEQRDELQKIVDLEKQMDNLAKHNAETIKEETDERKKASEESRKAADEEEAAHQKRVAELEEEMRLEDELNRKASDAVKKRMEEEQKLANAAKRRQEDAIANLKFEYMRKNGQTEQAAIQEAIYSEARAQGKDVSFFREKATKRELKNWGRRYNPETGEYDGEQKQAGWRGIIPIGKGKTMTEVSTGVNINGKEVEIPLIIPSSTQDDLVRIAKIANGEITDIPDDLLQKAVDFAKSRMAEGKSVFYNGEARNVGWQGEVKTRDGRRLTDVPVEADIDGKKVQIPLIVPESTEADLVRIAKVANGEITKIPADLLQKAIDHAKQRISEGKSVFAGGDKNDEANRNFVLTDLDSKLVEDITKRTQAELALQSLQTARTTSPELYAPRVNSLIARGGSEAPMKLPKVEEYQAKTLNSVDKISKDMSFVRNYLKENGLI